jgi:TolB-like protein/DNA-binding SARP family transcriptional activator/Tfp pilus assembly protein PilF
VGEGVAQSGHDQTAARSSFEILGPLRVRKRTGEDLAIRSKAALALLLYLAANRGRRQRREKLAPLLWPDGSDEQARANLRQALFSLKDALGDGAPAVQADGEEVWLDEALIEVDAWRFLASDEAPDREAFEPEPGLSIGELADGFEFPSEDFARWLATERVRMRDLACDRLARSAARLSAAARIDDAIRVNQTIIALDPVREDAHRALMTLHLAAGRRGAALRQYACCAEILRRELDVEPDAATQRLYEQIRNSQSNGKEPVAQLGPEDTHQMTTPESAAIPYRGARPRRALRAAAILAVAAAPIALGALWSMVPSSTPGGPTAATSTPAAEGVQPNKPSRPVAPALSLVVLPFVNLSAENKDEWFVDGITEELTTDLSRVPNALVIARSSAFTYKGKFFDVRQIGRELNVRYVIEGSVRRDGDQVRLLLQIADASSGGQVWSERYTFNRAELTKTLDLVVASVARAIQLKLEDTEGRRLERQWSANADAAELTMRARALMNAAPRERLKAIKAAIQLLERATEIDPNSVSAWSLLASARAAQVLRRGHDQREPNDQDIVNSAAQAARRALALDPHSVSALLAMGHVKRAAWQPDEAIKFYERAQSLNPNYSPILGELARAYALTGRAAEAVPLYDLSIRLSPKDPNLATILSNRCSAQLMLGKYIEAVADCEEAMKLGSAADNLLARLAMANLWAGNQARAREVAAQYRLREPNMTVRSCKALNHPSNHSSYRAFVERGCNAWRALGFPE